MTCHHCGTDHHEDDLRACRDVLRQQRDDTFVRNVELERSEVAIVKGQLAAAEEKLGWMFGRHRQLMTLHTTAVNEHGREVARLTGEVARITAMLTEAPEYVGLPQAHETRRLGP